MLDKKYNKRHGDNVKSPAGAILMKLATLGLLLTKNRMKNVLGTTNEPLGAILGVKGEYGYK